MRTYLAPLGFDSRRVIRPVLSEGLDADDEVVILRPSTKSNRGKDALKEVEGILTQVSPDLTLQTESLPHTDFVETVLCCTDLIQAANGETFVILGGGARELLFPLVVATFSGEQHVDTILQVSDIDGTVRRLPKLNLRGNATDAEGDLLSNLMDLSTPLSISQIADRMGKSKSTIARHVSNLEEEGLVETHPDGRAKSVVVTDSGRVFLKTMP